MTAGENKNLEPYRYFFPLGVLCAIWGTALWILFGFNLTQRYPGVHPDMMIGGFLFSFASGFLMTAVPRFTASFPARGWEIAVGLLFIALCMLFDLLTFFDSSYRAWELLICTLDILFIISFCARRFLTRKHDPPPTFAFVGVGLLFGFFGSLFLAGGEWEFFSPALALVGRKLYYQGMMLALVIGVGSRLVPALLGWAVNPLVELNSGKKIQVQGIKLSMSLALLLIFSFVLDFFIEWEPGRGLRALITTFVCLVYWKIHLKPPTQGILSSWIRMAGLFLCLGLWGYMLFPGYAIHALHLSFVGGFSLLTLLIATRVSLSHGNGNMTLEKNSKSLRGAAILLSLAAIGRCFAPAYTQGYTHHLAYASIVFIIGLLWWSYTFLYNKVNSGFR